MTSDTSLSGGSVRLSEMSRQATTALAELDAVALEELIALLNGAEAGQVAIEREAAAGIRARQKVLAEVLMITEQNIRLLRRLQEPKEEQGWDLYSRL